MLSSIQKMIKLAFQLKYNLTSRQKIRYITEYTGWVIKDIGKRLEKNFGSHQVAITSLPFGFNKKIIHYGSASSFFSNHLKIPLFKRNNKIIVTWYHVVPNHHYSNFSKLAPCVDIWHTSNQFSKSQLIDLGISNKKIVVIPIGVDREFQVKTSPECKKQLRTSYEIEEDAWVIGSFQKDGNGWGEGNQPKLVKGPDVLCDALELLSKKRKLFVLLSGPSRGYVKKRLKQSSIPYHHEYFETPSDILPFYQMCDQYIIASRVEGGPIQMMEAMAAGIPVVSTNMGMPADYMVDGENGFLVPSEDVEAITKASLRLIENFSQREAFISAARNTVASLFWDKIFEKYESTLYKSLLESNY